MARTPPSAATRQLITLTAQYVRAPSESWDEDGVATLVFAPPLTAQEQSTFDTLRRLATAPTIVLTPADLTALEPRLATGRLFLQQSQADFIAKGQNVRDRELFDNVSALWRVIFRLTREQ